MTYDNDNNDQEWNDAEPYDGDGDYTPVPTGAYQAMVERAEVKGPDEWRDCPCLSLMLRIISDGPAKNKCVFPEASTDNQYLRTLKTWSGIFKLDPPPKTRMEMLNRCASLNMQVVNIRVVHRPDKPKYPRIYINSWVGWIDEMDGGGPPPIEDDGVLRDDQGREIF
jgi:hypothetical protein